MGLREKLIYYTNDLGGVDLKQEAIATIAISPSEVKTSPLS